MRVFGLGQCSLDHIAAVRKYPEEDSKEEALELTVQGGGPVATALVSLSRLGVRTAFAGVVSDDRAGAEIIEGLKAEGVDTRGLKVKKGGSSQTAFIIVSRKGLRTIIWRRPDVPELDPEDINASLIKGADFVLLDGLMMKASLKAAMMARRFNVPVMLDAGRVREGMRELAGSSDYIVCSEEFARGLGSTPREALFKLSSLGPRAATVTLGKKGSITWSDGKTFVQKAFRVKAVDTTGAGDVFHGGYIWGLLNGWDMKKTVRFASAFAALKCLKPGGRLGIPSLRRTLEFLKKSGA